jgi:hypothetical protein
MRKVEIIEVSKQAYKWMAIDRTTGRLLLRLRELSQLGDVCDRLEWRVIDVKSLHLRRAPQCSAP